MDNAIYERNELAEAFRHEREVDSQSLSDRKENQKSFSDIMRNHPEDVAERVALLLDGSYGYGPMLLAQRCTRRMNRQAIFTQLIAVFEWQCPRRMATDAWKKLTQQEKNALQRYLDQVITDYDNRASEIG